MARQNVAWRMLASSVIMTIASAKLVARQIASTHSDFSFIDKWAAVGDSYSAGIGAGTRLSTDWQDRQCSRYGDSHPALLNSWLRLRNGNGLEWQYLSCSGATSPQMLELQVPVLDSPKMVTLSAGGNDVELSEILNSCVYMWGPKRSCEEQLTRSNDIIHSDEFASNITSLINGIIKKMDNNEKYKIFYTGYMAPLFPYSMHLRIVAADVDVLDRYAPFFNEDTDECDNVTWAFKQNIKLHAGLSVWGAIRNSVSENDPEYLTKDRRKVMNQMVSDVNDVIKAAVKRAGERVVFVDYAEDFVKAKGRYCEDGVDENNTTSPQREELLFYEWGTQDGLDANVWDFGDIPLASYDEAVEFGGGELRRRDRQGGRTNLKGRVNNPEAPILPENPNIADQVAYYIATTEYEEPALIYGVNAAQLNLERKLEEGGGLLEESDFPEDPNEEDLNLSSRDIVSHFDLARRDDSDEAEIAQKWLEEKQNGTKLDIQLDSGQAIYQPFLDGYFRVFHPQPRGHAIIKHKIISAMSSVWPAPTATVTTGPISSATPKSCTLFDNPKRLTDDGTPNECFSISKPDNDNPTFSASELDGPIDNFCDSNAGTSTDNFGVTAFLQNGDSQDISVLVSVVLDTTKECRDQVDEDKAVVALDAVACKNNFRDIMNGCDTARETGKYGGKKIAKCMIYEMSGANEPPSDDPDNSIASEDHYKMDWQVNFFRQDECAFDEDNEDYAKTWGSGDDEVGYCREVPISGALSVGVRETTRDYKVLLYTEEDCKGDSHSETVPNGKKDDPSNGGFNCFYGDRSGTYTVPGGPKSWKIQKGW